MEGYIVDRSVRALARVITYAHTASEEGHASAVTASGPTLPPFGMYLP
jgi:hypothetical protein